MKRLLLVSIAFCLSANISVIAQINLTEITKNSKLHYFEDPILKETWFTARFNLSSFEKSSLTNSRIRARASILKNFNEYFIMLSIRTPLEAWPFQQRAFLIVNNVSYEFDLNSVNSENYSVETSTTSMDANGNNSEDISTNDFQMFRLEGDISKAFRKNRTITSCTLIIYSGRLPHGLDFDEQEVELLNYLLGL